MFVTDLVHPGMNTRCNSFPPRRARSVEHLKTRCTLPQGENRKRALLIFATSEHMIRFGCIKALYECAAQLRSSGVPGWHPQARRAWSRLLHVWAETRAVTLSTKRLFCKQLMPKHISITINSSRPKMPFSLRRSGVVPDLPTMLIAYRGR